MCVGGGSSVGGNSVGDALAHAVSSAGVSSEQVRNMDTFVFISSPDTEIGVTNVPLASLPISIRL